MDYVTVDSGCNGKLIDNAYALRRRECLVHGGQLQLCRNQGHSQGVEFHLGSPREESQDTKTCAPAMSSAFERRCECLSDGEERTHSLRGGV